MIFLAAESMSLVKLRLTFCVTEIMTGIGNYYVHLIIAVEIHLQMKLNDSLMIVYQSE